MANLDSPDVLLRAAHRAAISLSYVHGFPTFGRDQSKNTYRIVVFTAGYNLDHLDIPRNTLNGQPGFEDVPSVFRAMQQYAKANGYITAMPDFEVKDYQDGKGPVYGSYQIQQREAEHIIDTQMPLRSTDPGNVAAVFQAVQDYAKTQGAGFGFPTFEVNGDTMRCILFTPHQYMQAQNVSADNLSSMVDKEIFP